MWLVIRQAIVEDEASTEGASANIHINKVSISLPWRSFPLAGCQLIAKALVFFLEFQHHGDAGQV
jgi:hypothetical protein